MLHFVLILSASVQLSFFIPLIIVRRVTKKMGESFL